MKFGIDPPGYRDSSVECMAFNLYAMHQQKLQDVINYINTYDEGSLRAACDAVGVSTLDITDDDIQYILAKTGRTAE